MARLPLRYYPAPVLTTVATEITEFDDELAKLVDDMSETMYADNGVGLAAPQVGVSKRLLVMDCGDPDDPEVALLYHFINPEILRKEGTIVWDEGCLSFPGLTVEVERAENVRVRAYDVEGHPFELELSGLEAVCVQHEIDHLDGITLIDRVGPIRRRVALQKWKKLRQELGLDASDGTSTPSSTPTATA
jgi:peptide deformylase